ncbi:dihydrolipoyllysine-residue acetyltransferase [Deinococcus sonorensis]|uniref:Acetyltransferase component of pyruvate dehydrogenase complex n=2 Tax=Deinococcus sonorensis TaxID=309891 RepID=A0AAU7UF37_9DEIO
MAQDVKLPEVGDNIEQGTVVTVLVKPGDSITEGQAIIEIETDKAVVEVPSSSAGTVAEVRVKEGDTVPVGGVILTLGEGGGAAAPAGDTAVPMRQTEPDSNLAEPDSSTTADTGTAGRVAQAQQQSQKEQAEPAASTPAAPAPTASAGAEVTLPEVGDNVEQGTVVTVLVKPGDSITEGQAIIEIETDKAVVEVPSSGAGTVAEVRVKEGDTVKVGGVILTLQGGAATPASSPATAPATPTGPAPAQPATPAPSPTEVGSAPLPSGAQVGGEQPAAQFPKAPGTYNTQTYDGRVVVHAAPSVRRLARELGVDLLNVHGSGIAGRISEADVRGGGQVPQPQAQPAPTPAAQAPAAQPAAAPVAAPQAAKLPDFAKWGTIRAEDMSGIRKATVRSMTQAWTTIPMVTHFDKADVTRMEEVRKAFGARVEKAGGKLTMTVILMKVVANALRKFPKFGASLDLTNNQVIYKDYVHIGVAVDTPNGLLVPVMRDVDRKSITELAVEIGEIAGKARDRKLKPDEMQGATFSISNLGGIGGHAFTPIVNPPEVAILGVSRGGFEPVWNRETGSFEPRNMLPLSLTYDHRLIDGADAARFVRFICEALEDPFLISL